MSHTTPIDDPFYYVDAIKGLEHKEYVYSSTIFNQLKHILVFFFLSAFGVNLHQRSLTSFIVSS